MANALNSSSASVLRPDFMNCNACAYCCVARSGIGVASTGVALPPAAPGAPAVVGGAAVAVAVVLAEAGAAAAPSPDAGARDAFSGAL
jgi:hypothetical protein